MTPSDARPATWTEIWMDTPVTIALGPASAARPAADDPAAAARAFAWFQRVEACCTRFDPDSELMRLAARGAAPTPVSALLFEAVRFALAVAEASGGAFDPTVGRAMEARGFNRHYRTGSIVHTRLDADGPGSRRPASWRPVSWRDVGLEPARREITLRRPLILDLGAVAKGLAIDLAARALRADSQDNFAIDAGGDLYLAGCNPAGAPWRIGIRHPRRPGELLESIEATDQAVCTSGDYERPAAIGQAATGQEDGAHHILDPRSGTSAQAAISATVTAPSAMVADALSTAALVLGPEAGIAFLERQQVGGIIISPRLERYATLSPHP